jgi:hypothetical protein
VRSWAQAAASSQPQRFQVLGERGPARLACRCSWWHVHTLQQWLRSTCACMADLGTDLEPPTPVLKLHMNCANLCTPGHQQLVGAVVGSWGLADCVHKQTKPPHTKQGNRAGGHPHRPAPTTNMTTQPHHQHTKTVQGTHNSEKTRIAPRGTRAPDQVCHQGGRGACKLGLVERGVQAELIAVDCGTTV